MVGFGGVCTRHRWNRCLWNCGQFRFQWGGDVRSADLPDLRKRDRHHARARYHSREEASAVRVAGVRSATDKARYRRWLVDGPACRRSGRDETSGAWTVYLSWSSSLYIVGDQPSYSTDSLTLSSSSLLLLVERRFSRACLARELAHTVSPTPTAKKCCPSLTEYVPRLPYPREGSASLSIPPLALPRHRYAVCLVVFSSSFPSSPRHTLGPPRIFQLVACPTPRSCHRRLLCAGSP